MLIGTTCILHSQVVVVSLHCRWCWVVVVVVELLSCCRYFKYQAEIIEAYVKYYCCLVVVYVVKFRWWVICLSLLNVKSHPFCLNVASTWVTCRYPGLVAEVSWFSCVVLRSLWYVTGWGYLLCFSTVAYYLWIMLSNLLKWDFHLSSLCWGRSAKVVE